MKESKRVPLIVYTVIALVIFVLLAAGAYFLGQRKADAGTAADSSQIAWVESDTQDNQTESSATAPAYPEGADVGSRWDLTPAEKYEIQVGFGDIKICSTNQTPCVTIESDRKVTLDQTVKGDTCHLDFDANKRLTGKWDVHITIWLPEENLRELAVDMAAGALHIDAVRADEFNLDMSAGQTNVEGCDFRTADLELIAGELTFSADTDIQKVDAEVTAGLMKLLLPKSIPSFQLDYEATFGGFDNQSGFSMDGKQSSTLIGNSGTLRYGNQPYGCRIDLEVRAGQLEFFDY